MSREGLSAVGRPGRVHRGRAAGRTGGPLSRPGDQLCWRIRPARTRRSPPRSPRSSARSDGLFADAEGHIYLTDWEHNAVWVRTAPGVFFIIAQDTTALWWPDSLALG